MLRRWDEVTLALSNVGGARRRCWPTCIPTRRCGPRSEKAEVEVDKLVTELRQDRALYEVFAGARRVRAGPDRRPGCSTRPSRTSGAPASTATTRPGPGSPRSTSGSPTLDQEFSRNIRDDVRYVKVTPDRLAGLPQDWLDAHPADDDGLVTVTHRLPRLGAGADVRARRRGRAPTSPRRSSSEGWPQNDAAAQGDVRPAPRAGRPGGLRRLGVVRRRREDDRERTGHPGVHRQDRGRGREADAARPRGRCSSGCGATSRTPRRSTRPDSLVLRGAGPQGAARRRLPAGAHLLRRSTRCGRGCSRSPAGCSGCATSRCPTRPRWHEDVAVYDVHRAGDGRTATASRSAGSTSTSSRARGSTSTPRSSRSPTGSAAGSCPRARWCATSTAA